MDVILTGGFGRTSSSFIAKEADFLQLTKVPAKNGIETNHYEKKRDFQKIRQITFRACCVFLFLSTIAIRYSQDPGGRI